MKTKNIMSLAILGAALLASCSKDNNETTEPVATDNVVKFGVELSKATVGFDATYTTQFEEGDTIFIWAVERTSDIVAAIAPTGNYADAVPYIYSAGGLQAANPSEAIVLPTNGSSLDYYAAYLQNLSFATRVLDPTGLQFDAGEDLYMTSRNVNATLETPAQFIDLTFAPKPTLVEVKLSGFTANAKIKMRMKNVKAEIDFTQTLTSEFQTIAGAEYKEVEMGKPETDIYRLFVPAETYLADEILFKVTDGTDNFNFSPSADTDATNGHVLKFKFNKFGVSE